jgi:hypothetical protein
MAKRRARAPATKEKAAKFEMPTRRTCATMEVHEYLLRNQPGYREARDAIETYAWRAMWSPMVGRTGCTKIPVVVHVVYRTAAENISDAQIKSQIEVLNADYRAKNADVSTVPAPFHPLVGDARLQFELATADPSGNPTNGIIRKSTTVAGFTQNNAVKAASSGGSDPWPADRYLNIWVCQLGGGLLGYAQFPGGPAATDGVVILHSAFGTTGTATAPFNLGRSATHEIGHWLNLRHIWGDDGGGCSGDDFVADTPNQGGEHYGTPAFPQVSCGNGPNGDMFMNYMDYVDDSAMVMFTAGQVTRMQAALDTARSTIGTTVSCGPKPIKETTKEFPKDPPKELPKDPPKEFHKELHKDPPKELPKELHKDPPKDLHKDFPKEITKELHKDPGFDPQKPIFDPPKPFDPPKVGFDQPGGLGGLGGPVAQGGGVPFVLATPSGFAQPGRDASSLAAAYSQLLAQYAQLHAAGQLDEAGMSAWQQLSQAYQQLVSGGRSP